LKAEQPEKKGKVTFKSYDQHQLIFLPASLDELVPANHLVRVVNQVVDQIDIRVLEKSYEGGGASSYHPKMMLKVLIYAYSTKIYSSRKIDQALQQNVHFMWLAAMQRPDFRTINNFRNGRLKTLIEDAFQQVLLFLIEHQYVKLENYFTDGTKMAADANKYSYVWAKNTERYKQNVKEKIKELLKQIDEENQKEEQQYGDDHLEEYGENSSLNSEQITEKARRINEGLKQSQDEITKKEIRKKQSQAKKLETYAESLARYEDQERLLAGRGSYSKTDPNATFMRMKNDELLPGYTTINGTENQYIVNYTIEQSAGESQAFPTHMQKLKQRTKGRMPKRVIADAGFGSEENYAYLEKQTIDNYLKYSGIYYEKSKKYRENRFHKDHFEYDQQTDTYTCPNHQQLVFEKETFRHNANGYANKIRKYRSRGCGGCTYSQQCKRTEEDRVISFSAEYERYKQQVRENYNTTTGISMQKRRGWDVETPFADIKHNQNYRRFRLRGLDKVNIEWGLLSISHNLRKVAISEEFTLK